MDVKKVELEPNSLFYKIDKKNYDNNYCFLCGIKLNRTNRSDEHVIPKWIQRKYCLRNEELYLLNGTSIKYRNLKIPCCSKCNNEYLSKLEKRIATAEAAGYDSFVKLSRYDIFYWVSKIYYGLIYRELSLLRDIRNPQGGYLLDSEYLQTFRSHYMFLQGIRGKHICDNFFPSSLFIVKVQKPNNIKYQWDLLDIQNKIFIALRFGEIGIIAPLQDMESIDKSFNLDDIYKFELNPDQFCEIAAAISCYYFSLNRIPKFLSFESEEGLVHTSLSSLQGLSNKPIFDKFDEKLFIQILSMFTRLPIDEISPEPGKILSFMYDENKQPVFRPIEELK